MVAAARHVYAELWSKVPVFSCEEGLLQGQAGETAESQIQPAHRIAGENPDLHHGEPRVNTGCLSLCFMCVSFLSCSVLMETFYVGFILLLHAGVAQSGRQEEKTRKSPGKVSASAFYIALPVCVFAPLCGYKQSKRELESFSVFLVF